MHKGRVLSRAVDDAAISDADMCLSGYKARIAAMIMAVELACEGKRVVVVSVTMSGEGCRSLSLLAKSLLRRENDWLWP